MYRLGKLPAQDTVKIALGDYLLPSLLPPLPEGDFGHQSLVTQWGMLGNGFDPANPPYAPNGVGDCAIAGPYHGLQLWNAEGGNDFSVTTDCVLKTYAAVTGYDPAQYDAATDNNPTDQGSNCQDVAQYWKITGFTDAAGRVHKIDSYVALQPGDWQELLYGLYLFDGVGIGVNLPSEWMAQTAAGLPWDAVDDPDIEGGHYILGVGITSGCLNVVTWGKQQLITRAGYEQFNDETWIYLSEEKLRNGKTLDGFNLEQLIADMKALAA